MNNWEESEMGVTQCELIGPGAPTIVRAAPPSTLYSTINDHHRLYSSIWSWIDCPGCHHGATSEPPCHNWGQRIARLPILRWIPAQSRGNHQSDAWDPVRLDSASSSRAFKMIKGTDDQGVECFGQNGYFNKPCTWTFVRLNDKVILSVRPFSLRGRASKHTYTYIHTSPFEIILFFFRAGAVR